MEQGTRLNWTGIEALRKDLVQQQFKGSKETFYSFGAGSGELVEPPEAIILLEFDSLMMGYKDRSRFLPSERLQEVSRSQGMISRTILVNGFVAATWRKKKERDGIAVSVASFRDLRARERRSIEERFAEYGDYLGTNIRVGFRGTASKIASRQRLSQ
jgi:hypothetical protein